MTQCWWSALQHLRSGKYFKFYEIVWLIQTKPMINIIFWSFIHHKSGLMVWFIGENLVCPWVSEVICAEVETEWSGCSGDTWDMSVTGDDDTLSSDDCSSRTKHLRLVLLSCWDIPPGKMSMSVRSEELTRSIIDIVSRSAPRQSVIDIQHIDYCKTFFTELSECENWSWCRAHSQSGAGHWSPSGPTGATICHRTQYFLQMSLSTIVTWSS